jgi:hypothetical protein
MDVVFASNNAFFKATVGAILADRAADITCRFPCSQRFLAG